MTRTGNNIAVAYYRTSSAANVGADKDSLKRQQDAVQSYAAAHGLTIVHEFYDAAVSGADPVGERAGFDEMLTYMLGNEVRIVLLESASRFARDLVVQITGHALLKRHGIELIPVDAPQHFTEDTPTAVMVRAILGAVAEFEKNTLVARMRKARDRRSAALGRRCEGRPDWPPRPAAHVQRAQALRQEGLSLRAISAQLAAEGLLSSSGRAYLAGSVAGLLERAA